MTEQQFEGRSVAEAAIKACEALGVTRANLQYRVISETGELLSRKVVIEASASGPKSRDTEPAPAAPRPAAAPRQAPPPAPAAPPVSSAGASGADVDAGVAAAPPRRPRHTIPAVGSAPPANAPGAGRPRRPEGGERGDRGGRPPRGERSRGERAEAAERSDRPERGERSDRPERSERADRPERSERGERGGRGRGPRRDAGEAREARGGEARGGEARSGGRGRTAARSEGPGGHDDGIEALLRLDPAAASVPTRPALEPSTPRGTRAVKLADDLVRLLGMEMTARLVADEEIELHIDLVGADEGRIIGVKGEVLLALQFVLNRMLSRDEEEGQQVVVLDAGGYRDRRRNALQELARRLAHSALEQHKAVRLSPMSAHDRRVFHMALKEVAGVSTRSEGDGLYRSLLIIPSEAA